MKFGIIVVIYNVYLKDVRLYNQLKAIDGDYEVVFVDNSNKKEFIEANVNENFSGLISLGDNLGLSKAYNKAIEYLKKFELDYYLIFDGDSIIEPIYFEKLQALPSENNVIYLSQIKNMKDELVYPKVITTKNYQGDISQANESVKLEGINSGMIISSDFFKEYRYDENLFLYYIDSKIMQDAYQRGTKIKMFEGIILQNFNSEEIKSKTFMQNKHNFELLLLDQKRFNSNLYFLRKLFFIKMYFFKTFDVRYLKYIFFNNK